MRVSRAIGVIARDIQSQNGELDARLGDAQEENRELKSALASGRTAGLKLEKDLAKADERFQQQAQVLEDLRTQHAKIVAANDSLQQSLEKQARALGKSEKKEVGLRAKLAAQEAILVKLTSKIRGSTTETENDG